MFRPPGHLIASEVKDTSLKQGARGGGSAFQARQQQRAPESPASSTYPDTKMPSKTIKQLGFPHSLLPQKAHQEPLEEGGGTERELEDRPGRSGTPQTSTNAPQAVYHELGGAITMATALPKQFQTG